MWKRLARVFELENAEPHIDLAALGQALQCELRVALGGEIAGAVAAILAQEIFLKYTQQPGASSRGPCIQLPLSRVSPGAQNPKTLNP